MTSTQKTPSLFSNIQNGVSSIDSKESSQISQAPILNVVDRLCKALEQENINYCHWKSNLAIDRSANGENDLDLLISRADVQRFTEILARLGFKEAEAPREMQMPGVLDYYCYDEESDKLVHVHAHYQLVLGHDRTKNYRLPIEQPFLASATQAQLFRLPSIEFEFIVLVIRLILKYSTWDVILTGKGNLPASAQSEFEDLLPRVDWSHISDILKQHLPYLDRSLFDACVQSIQSESSIWTHIQVGHQLQKTLQAYARRPHLVDVALKFWRSVERAVYRRVRGHLPRKGLSCGGSIVAIVGGDGAGKSTVVAELDAWLSSKFDTAQFHLGKPPRSLTTNLVRGALKVGRFFTGIVFGKTSPPPRRVYTRDPIFPGYSALFWHLCSARDRYLSYQKAQRFASNGGIVLCDRFPVPDIELMDSPQIERVVDCERRNWLTDKLMTLEQCWYQYISSPEILIILKLDPEIAVRRKTDEKAEHVRPRSEEIWTLDLESTGAAIVDASRTKAQVLSDIKSLVWSRL